MTKDCHSPIRKLGAAATGGALALLMIAGAAFAQATTSQMDGLKLDKNEPIQIESDKLEIHDQEHKADFTGNVKVVQGKTTLQAGHMDAVPDHEEEVPDDFAPAIVAESTKQLKTMSVATAVMALDMTDEPLLLFRSPGKEHLNIVYRRHDGNIGWIDAANIKS